MGYVIYRDFLTTKYLACPYSTPEDLIPAKQIHVSAFSPVCRTLINHFSSFKHSQLYLEVEK